MTYKQQPFYCGYVIYAPLESLNADSVADTMGKQYQLHYTTKWLLTENFEEKKNSIMSFMS